MNTYPDPTFIGGVDNEPAVPTTCPSNFRLEDCTTPTYPPGPTVTECPGANLRACDDTLPPFVSTPVVCPGPGENLRAACESTTTAIATHSNILPATGASTGQMTGSALLFVVVGIAAIVAATRRRCHHGN